MGITVQTFLQEVPNSKIAQMVASKQIISLLLLCALVSASTATFQWPIYHYEPAPLCECFNPFQDTRNHYRGDPEALCSDFCYVECNRACSDEKPTASRGRCQSTLACRYTTEISLPWQTLALTKSSMSSMS